MASSDSNQLSPLATDETGNPYGDLIVEEYLGKTNGGDTLWLCRCKCGNTTVVARGDLRKKKGPTRSCGCGRMTQGGGHGTTEYTTWKEMKRRCYNPRFSQYHLHGGRGICICDGWRASFVNFLADMGPKPSSEHSVERIDNDGHYSCGHCEECLNNEWPANCKWATPLEQGQNTRKVRLIEFNGETLSLRAWARKLGIQHRTLSVRIEKWGLENAFTTPAIQTEFNMLTHDGETLCVAEWARKTGIHEATIRWRIKAGWDSDKVLAP